MDNPGYAAPLDDKWIVIAGNVIDGFRFFGPFEAQDIAEDYADVYLDADWNVTTIKAPSE